MRVFPHARLVSFLVGLSTLAASAASAQDLLYLRGGGLLQPEAPAAGAATASLTSHVANGENVLLGTFTSATLPQDLQFGQARAVVYLGTGRPGMSGCARVAAQLVRLTGAAESTVASGELVATIRSRRNVFDPIIVPMAVTDPLLAAADDRIMLQVRVRNECGGGRDVTLMYNSVGRPSRVEFVVAVTTTTSVTTTTVTTATTPTSSSTTTTTTLPPPTCLDVATGLAAVRCRLEAMDTIIRTTSPSQLGGGRFAGRLVRRVERALKFVRGAELVATPRKLRKGRRQIVMFSRQLARGWNDGRVASEVGAPLDALSAGALGGLDALIAGN